MHRFVSRSIRLLILALLTISLGACGNDGSNSGNGNDSGSSNTKEMSGVYEPQGQGMYERFEFRPGHKVAVTFIAAQPRVVDYVAMPDGRIQILGDKVQPMRQLDEGCLMLRGPGDDGVEIDVPEFGRYCRR